MSVLPFSFIVFFPLIKSIQGLNDSVFAPQGCLYEDGVATCDFRQWIPPLRDEDFKPERLHGLKLKFINGTIPAGAFSGLNGPLAEVHTAVDLYCDSGRTTLSRDIFTPNLQWLRDLRIINCHLDNSLPSRLLENLHNLEYIVITGGKIDGFVAYDTLAGLSNLRGIAINAQVTNGSLPSGLFDGLENLTMIGLKQAELNYIPPDLFNGLDKLQQINLSNNTLKILPSKLFDETGSLTHVWLQHNPWNCSCELRWLLDWSNITDSVVCQYPSGFEGIMLEDAFKFHNCTSTEPTVLSTPVSLETEIPEIWTTSLSFFGAATGSVSYNRRNEEGKTNGIPTKVLLSVFGAFALLIAGSAVLYLNVCRNKSIWRMNLVSNGEDDRHGSDPRGDKKDLI